ncbi:hypothetical protein [Methylobacterium sp. JK268]
MAERIRLTPTVVKVSKPGFDVNSARDADLLLSLGLRTGQIIQRGYAPAPTPTSSSSQTGRAIWNMTIGFPAQATTPDFWFGLDHGGSDVGNVVNSWAPVVAVTLGLSSVALRIDTLNGTQAGPPGFSGLIYAIFRKRITG